MYQIRRDKKFSKCGQQKNLKIYFLLFRENLSKKLELRSKISFVRNFYERSTIVVKLFNSISCSGPLLILKLWSKTLF